MPIHENHFTLFGLPERFALDTQALDAAYKRVQGQIHPDRFASATAAERRVAMQWAARANEALTTLRSPLHRAAYLCELNGVPIDAESNTAMPGVFMAQQMQWREELDAARGSGRTRYASLFDDVAEHRERTLRELEQALDVKRDFHAAAALVRQFMFIEKFSDELAAAAETAGVGAG